MGEELAISVIHTPDIGHPHSMPDTTIAVFAYGWRRRVCGWGGGCVDGEEGVWMPDNSALFCLQHSD